MGEVVHELTNTTNVIDFLKGRGKDAKPEPLRESEVMRMLGTADEINENLEEGVNDRGGGLYPCIGCGTM